MIYHPARVWWGTMETSTVRREKLLRILKDYEGGGTG
jgi:hypothetical protein